MSAHPAAITEMKSVNATKVTMRHITRLHRRAILIAIVSSIWQKDTRISMHYWDWCKKINRLIESRSVASSKYNQSCSPGLNVCLET
jgi:hypothetical protein